MTTYRVRTPVRGTATVLVEARDAEEAKHLALQREDWQLGDDWEAIAEVTHMSADRETDPGPAVQFDIGVRINR